MEERRRKTNTKNPIWMESGTLVDLNVFPLRYLVLNSVGTVNNVKMPGRPANPFPDTSVISVDRSSPKFALYG